MGLDPRSELGIVAIGRNEGNRLLHCLESLDSAARAGIPIVYVDSGSTDGSPDLARSRGMEVIDLEPSAPFTAARARNAGVARLRMISPRLKTVQFIDGDCQLVEGWLDHGDALLRIRAEVAVVFGRVRERFRRASIYNSLCDMEWDTPMGEVAASGGIALARVEALEQVDGFDESAIAAEDTELCARLCARGWKILHIEKEMAIHDAAMLRFRQWWMRSLRSGYAYSFWSRPRARGPRLFTEEVRRIWFWALVLPGAALLACPFTRGFSLLLLTAYLVQGSRVFRQRRKRGNSPRDAALYSIHCVLAKFPQLWGILRFRWEALKRKEPRLIEHKQSVPENDKVSR